MLKVYIVCIDNTQSQQDHSIMSSSSSEQRKRKSETEMEHDTSKKAAMVDDSK